METSGKRSWYFRVTAIVFLLLLITPLLASAERPSREDRINSIRASLIERLCALQEARGNRMILIDPTLCAPPAPPPAPTPPPPAPIPPPPPPSPEPTPPPPPEGSVVINEIMYAPSGADAGHEWVEVMNGTSAAVDLSEWKLFENGTNHGLALSQGVAIVPAGGFAIIADNATQFLADNPSFAGALFDSAFSLGNTGETIAIIDAEGNSVDEVTYSSSQGAFDDGNTLQRTGETWVAATPTPGS